MSADAPATAPETAPSDLELRVKAQGGDEIVFKVRPSTRLGKLMRAYCDQVGCKPGKTRFLYDGNRINEDDTPSSLGLENHDIIDAVYEMIGGGKRKEPPSAKEGEDEEEGEEEDDVSEMARKQLVEDIFRVGHLVRESHYLSGCGRLGFEQVLSLAEAIRVRRNDYIQHYLGGWNTDGADGSFPAGRAVRDEPSDLE